MTRRAGRAVVALLLCASLLPLGACKDEGAGTPPAAKSSAASAPVASTTVPAASVAAPSASSEAPATKATAPAPSAAAPAASAVAPAASPEVPPVASALTPAKPEPQVAEIKPAKEPKVEVNPEGSLGYSLRSNPLPEEKAPEAERRQAQTIVDFSNDADRILVKESCGRWPLRIHAASISYRTIFAVGPLKGRAPSKDCAVKSLRVPKALEPIREALEKDLAIIDAERESMQKVYGQLCAYAADTSIVDDGKRGEKLCEQLDASWQAFSSSRERFMKAVGAEADKAQDVLLKGHPFRRQIRMANGILDDFRAAAERIGASEPDPRKLSGVVATLGQDIEQAQRMPFPVKGEAERAYRKFLRSAELLLATLERGRTESFHPGVRAAMNGGWRDCREDYNAFLDSISRVSMPAK